MFCSELTIKDKVLKIFTVLLLTNVNLIRTQTTKSALRYRRSISLNENENDFLWGCSQRNFSGFKLLYRLAAWVWYQWVKFLKTENQECLHADPWLGKRFFLKINNFYNLKITNDGIQKNLANCCRQLLKKSITPSPIFWLHNRSQRQKLHKYE